MVALDYSKKKSPRESGDLRGPEILHFPERVNEGATHLVTAVSSMTSIHPPDWPPVG